MQHYYPDEDDDDDEEYGNQKGRKTITQEIQPDGSLLERTETIMPDGSKIVEETIHRTAAPPRYNSRRPDAPLYEQTPPQRRHHGHPHPHHPPQKYAAPRSQGYSHDSPSSGGGGGCCAGEVPKFGASAACPPRSPPHGKTGKIAWAWCPEWSWLNVLFRSCLILGALGFALLIVGASFADTALIVVGLVLALIGFPGFYILGIWRWNAQKQEAYMLARGKQVETRKLWKEADPVNSHEARDTFFETKYGGKTLRVLRDGTIEVYGSHRVVQTSSGGNSGGDGGEFASSAAEAAVQGLGGA